MILGALVDAGVSLKKLQKNLSALHIKGYKLNARAVKRAGIRATKVDVEIRQGSGVRGQGSAKKWRDIEEIIRASSISRDIKQKGMAIFKRLFEAEAEVHGVRFDKVHLHELGAVDCIIDIFGALIGLDALGIEEIHSSPLNLGGGRIKTGHGILSVPAPATAALLKNIPVYSSDIYPVRKCASFNLLKVKRLKGRDFLSNGVNFVASGDPPGRELTTPTGAVLISSLADNYGPMPEMQISKIGIGAGSRDFKNQPNVLTILIGKKTENTLPCHSRENGNPEKNKLDSCWSLSRTLIRGRNDENQGGFPEQKITIIETNIDDMNPQIYEYVMERLFKAGALDVFLTQIIMKKGRPGIKLTVLCSNDKKEDLMRIILKETTSIGLRFYEVGRRTLDRQIRAVNTKFGKIKVKISDLGDDIIKYTPEYEDCRKIAKKLNVPLLDVIKMVNRNFQG